ncbi:MAG: hypothetical protein KGJ02_03295 [Verrucomicrobiota bacterium]|nr:hypothetical protein [Verrucomicrobiota bacterium]
MRWLFVLFACVLSAEERPFVVLKAHEIGMFGAFNQVLALVKLYDRGLYRGMEVDFGKKGLYYDPAHGDNWWTYYCDPISVGEREGVLEVSGDVPYARRREAEWYTMPEEAFSLIEKYIHFKPHILEKVRAFEEAHFRDHVVIGVHYRGTDKLESEASKVYPFDVFRHVQQLVRQLLMDRIKYKIFVASDEQRMVDMMKSMFSTHFCCQEKALRAVKGRPPPHFDRFYDRYLCGEEALIDCLLLSKCDLLVRTSSNLSLWATYLNPTMPVTELNQRIDDEKPVD